MYTSESQFGSNWSTFLFGILCRHISGWNIFAQNVLITWKRRKISSVLNTFYTLYEIYKLFNFKCSKKKKILFVGFIKTCPLPTERVWTPLLYMREACVQFQIKIHAFMLPDIHIQNCRRPKRQDTQSWCGQRRRRGSVPRGPDWYSSVV